MARNQESKLQGCLQHSKQESKWIKGKNPSTKESNTASKQRGEDKQEGKEACN